MFYGNTNGTLDKIINKGEARKQELPNAAFAF